MRKKGSLWKKTAHCFSLLWMIVFFGGQLPFLSQNIDMIHLFVMFTILWKSHLPFYGQKLEIDNVTKKGLLSDNGTTIKI